MQIIELLIIVFLNGRDLLPDIGQLPYLVFHLILELTDLVLEVIHTEFVQHDHVMVPVLTQQTLEADAAQVVFAESFDLLCGVDLALALQELTNLIVLL